MAENKIFQLQIISPERIFYEGNADMVELKTTEGEVGIYAEHIPLTAIVAPGILRIMQGEETKIAALHEGFIQILKHKVTILAESCEWPEDIDLNRAEEAKLRAERRIKSGDDGMNLNRAETALRRSLIRIEVVRNSRSNG